MTNKERVLLKILRDLGESIDYQGFDLPEYYVEPMKKIFELFELSNTEKLNNRIHSEAYYDRQTKNNWNTGMGR